MLEKKIKSYIFDIFLLASVFCSVRRFLQITKVTEVIYKSHSCAQLIDLKRSGKKNVNHQPAIVEEHLKQLKAGSVCSLFSPLSLLRNFWFYIVLFFCRRGREGQRAQTPKASTMCSLPRSSILRKTNPDLTNF